MVTFIDPTGIPADKGRLGFSGRNWDAPSNLGRGQLTTGERMPSAELSPGGPSVPLPRGTNFDLEGLVFDDPLTGRRLTGQQFLDRRLYTDAMLVMHEGRVVYETYRNGMNETDRHINHSTTKTLTTMLVGIAIADGRVDTSAPMVELVPQLTSIPAWAGITLQHILDMAAGLDTEEHYENANSMYWRYAEAVGYYEGEVTRQIGALAFIEDELTRVLEPPGTRFNYASYLTNLIPMAVENAYGMSALELLENRIYKRIGAERPALINLDRFGRPIVEGQLNLTLRDFARWSLPFLRDGLSLTGERILPTDWITETLTPSAERKAAFDRGESAGMFKNPQLQYHNQAWILDPARGIMAMLGIHGQYCYLDRSADLMISGYGSFPEETSPQLTMAMESLWSGVARALTT